jgi:hypothetical protein
MAGNPIDAISGAPAVGLGDHWETPFGGRSGREGFGRPSSRHDPEHALFTPLVGRLASAYPASESHAADTRFPPPVFLTDLLHGVGVYEFNMKLFAGAYIGQGSVINRFS